MPIITSLLDTDLYKFTMMQVVFHQFPSARVKYAFKCRNANASLAQHLPRLQKEIEALCALRFQPDELDYLRSLRFMKPDFVDFLEVFQLQSKHVRLEADGDRLNLTVDGPWLHTILFEVPLLAMVNQIAYETQPQEAIFHEGQRRLNAKCNLLQNQHVPGFRFSDFGTRRRFSKDWQRHVVRTLQQRFPTQFTGTSNVFLAKEFGLTPIGTMAHEYLQAFQALGGRLVDAQKNALDAWAQEYRGDLGIALTDVVGMDAFLRDFDLYFCKLFDGVRHDSGDPAVWAEKMLAHYRDRRIDARTKQFVFSDGLTMTSALDLYDRFNDQAQLFFGIGTHLTHDLGLEPLNVVIKMVSCNGQPVAKLSDSEGKAMCEDEAFLAYLKQVYGLVASTATPKSVKIKP
jgi:nicotinate phosphoribosyltransferase